jgi:prolyl-tRNA synthetase
MKMTRLFSQTLREAPADAEMPSHRLLVRSGFIRQLAAGIYTAMPLARRSLTKIENIIREEMNSIGGQEMTMPVVHPAELWQETQRWYQIGSEMGRFQDKNKRDMVLAMTHEEVVADLARKEIHSYRQLPIMIYHIQTKWRDDPRPRAGLVRVREFTMKDSYTLDADWEGLDRQYRNHYQAYFKIFQRCGLPVVAVKSDVGMMGGKLAHEFMYLTPFGEDTILSCDSCGYSANRQNAKFKKEALPAEELLETKLVETPNTKTITDLARFLDIPESKTAKAIFYTALVAEDKARKEKFIFAIIRGDLELNETKLVNHINAIEIRPSTDEEIKQHGLVPGYASPLGIQKTDRTIEVVVIIDELITVSHNLVSGANKDGYHLLNVNYGRDFEADIIADITTARDGDGCPQCASPLNSTRGVEVGNIFKLGTRYSDSMGCTFQDIDGIDKPIIMGSYGIGSGRLLACIAEEHNDNFGLIWPITISPYHVHLILLEGKDDSGKTYDTASELYHGLEKEGIEVLFDDRKESPGVKFNDADLIGLPLRVTVSARNLINNELEIKRRDQDKSQKKIVPLQDAIMEIKKEMDFLFSLINDEVIHHTYSD